MRVEITDLAETDLEQGYLFYELQQVGLGTYFLDALYSDMPRSIVERMTSSFMTYMANIHTVSALVSASSTRLSPARYAA